MRVVPTPDGAAPNRVPDWMRLAVPQHDSQTVAHVIGDAEAAPRVAAVVEALAQTGAFRQVVLSPPTDELRELGVPAYVRLPAGPPLFEVVYARLAATRPDVVVVHGHDEAALAGALAAARLRAALVRVGRAPGTCELSRVVDQLADLVLVHDQQDACELSRMRVPRERVSVIGNPLIDAVRWFGRDAAGDDLCPVVGVKPRSYVLAILAGASALDEQLAALAARTPLVLVSSNAELFADARAAGAIVAPPLGFRRRLAMIRSAGAVLTDSERAMEEAAAIGVRCHALGIAPSRIRAATTMDLRGDVSAIVAVRAVGDAPTPCAIPLWDGRAGTRVAQVMVANFARVRMLA